MTSTAIRRLLLIAALSVGGCSVKSLDNGIFACQTASDCASGEQCLENICRSAASLDGGGPEGGNCTEDCASLQEMCCGTICIDLATDNFNCGTCGTVCDATQDQNCFAGACTRETSCSDGIDNNGDGKVDCQDVLACPATTDCHGGGHCCNEQCAFENDATLCGNGLDDDCNGLTDCEDPGCAGQGCAIGSVCDPSRKCTPGCFIDGEFYAADDSNAEAPCLVCDPSTSTSSWTPAPEGTNAGQCVQPTQSCDGAGDCRRATGQPCGGNGDCASKSCTANVCL